jgi:hypothetical protein
MSLAWLKLQPRHVLAANPAWNWQHDGSDDVEVPMKKLLAAAVALVVILGAAPSFATPVSLELVLLVDVSGSIDPGEFNLQKNGYVNAFNNVAADFGTATPPEPFAVTLIYWSGSAQQQQAVDWTLIDSAASATAFANAVGLTTQPYLGATAPGNAIYDARMEIAGNSYEGDSLVIDISGDGQENNGIDTLTQATLAAGEGITINGLAIGGPALQTWYATHITNPGGGFLIGVSSFADFGDAIDQKISYEVNAIPEPGTLTLLGSALLGLAGFRRRKKA